MPIVFGDVALGFTAALLVTFIGIGVIANILIIYIVAQALGERKQNQEHEPGLD